MRSEADDVEDGARAGDVFVIMSTVAPVTSADRLGMPAYSYGYVADRFARLFDRLGIDYRIVDMPEYFGHPDSFVDAEGRSLAGRPIVHLCVRPFDQMRVIRGVCNITHVAWEYLVLKDKVLPGDTVLDVPSLMLARFDQVWMPSAFGCAAVEAHGVKSPVRIPSPFFEEDTHRVDHEQAVRLIGGSSCVPFRHNFSITHALNVELSRRRSLPLAHLLDGPGVSRVVLTVLNPGDPRKNLANMLTGFTYFAERHPDWVLLVKASQGGLDAPAIANLAITPKLAGIGQYDLPNVFVISDYLADEEMDALYSIADFYLSASLAEGQNLPLQEAMARGVVPIATRDTAMAEYIDDGSAVTIASRPTRTQVPDLAHSAAGVTVPVIDLADERDVLDALERAAKLSMEERDVLSAGARAAVARHLDADIIGTEVLARLRAGARVPA